MKGYKAGWLRPVAAWRGKAALFGVLLLNACEFPTSPPILQPRFVFPGASTTLSAAQLVPGSVTFVDGWLVVSLSGAARTWTLRELCGSACVAANGLVVPKPAFVVTLTTETGLPADVVSAQVRGGGITLRITNNLNFDPLRPSATAQGILAIQVRHAGEVIATRTYTEPLPPGSAADIGIPLQATGVTGAVEVVVTINSPAGDPVRIDTAGSITMSTPPPNTRLEMSEVVVRVENRVIQSAQTRLDLTDIDATTRDHVVEGALRLEVENPFAATGLFVLDIRPEDGAPIQKTLIPIQAGASTQLIPLTGEELRQMLGRNVTLSMRGVVNQTSQAGVTVRPTDVLRLRADLDVTFTTDTN